MKRTHLDFSTWKKKALKNTKIKAEYEQLQPEFSMIQAMVDVRVKKRVTQKELARKIGTKQSVISRLETGRGNPTVAFLKKLAAALNARLEIRFAMN